MGAPGGPRAITTGLCAVAVAVVMVLGLCPGALASASPMRATAGEGARQVLIYATYYGWYDNTPPGCATAYSGCAGGTGTYAHPITFASSKKEFPVGTILYYPTLEKYVVMGDDCQECDLDWTGKGPDGGPRFRHVDLWTGGKGGDEFDAINCEDALTQGLPDGTPIETPFIEDPPKDLPVSGEAIFDAKTGHCFGGARTSSSHGRYENSAAGTCLDDAASTAGTPATLAPCGGTPSEDLTYDGAFLVRGRLCLETTGSKPGARLVFAGCNGNADEQWSINPNGTITWIQYTFCVAEAGAAVELAKCSGSASDHWSFTSEG